MIVGGQHVKLQSSSIPATCIKRRLVGGSTYVSHRLAFPCRFLWSFVEELDPSNAAWVFNFDINVHLTGTAIAIVKEVLFTCIEAADVRPLGVRRGGHIDFEALVHIATWGLHVQVVGGRAGGANLLCTVSYNALAVQIDSRGVLHIPAKRDALSLDKGDLAFRLEAHLSRYARGSCRRGCWR